MHTAKSLLISICLCLALTLRNNVKLTSNYNASAVSDYAVIALPLQVPLSGVQKLHDPYPISYTPINQKYSIGLYSQSSPNLEWGGLKERMVHIDYAMIYEQNPPVSIFEQKYNIQYHLLESRQFYITIANPSEIITICINQIFSDCDSIKKIVKKSFPICINPFTKYPINFNLYVTHSRNRQFLKSAIFFNVTFKYENNLIYNRMWMRQVKFNLHSNHLKLLPFEIRNCQNENSVVTIKNPEKHDLSIMLIHKFKKYHTNGQPLDDKFTIGSQKTFRFLLQAKDSTITIYTRPVDNIDKSYPVLYVPVYCYDKAIIENVPIGTLYSNRMALVYPIFITSNTNSVLIVQQISILSSSNTVQLIRTAAHKSQIQSIERYAQIASFIVRSASKNSFKNSVTIKVKFSVSNAQNANSSFQIKKVLTYCQLYGAIQVGQNRFYEVSKLPDHQYNETQKIKHFNYSIINKMQIPIKMQRILFHTHKFKMHWFRYTAFHIFPERSKEQIMLQYTGPKQIPISPIKYAAALDFTGGILIPFQIMVFDRTLACLYQGKEIRCSALKYINFGYQKNEQKIQNQTIVFRNFNPHNITISIKHFQNIAKQYGLSLSIIISQPFPYYSYYIANKSQEKIQIFLQQGHYINVTIQMKIYSTPISGETLLQIATQYEQFTARVKFNFEQGKLLFLPKQYKIHHFDRQHQGSLQLLSTYQDIYQIRQIISDTTSLQFFFNQSHQYEPNQKIDIPFIYNPYRDENNLTNQCCSEQFLKTYYLHSLINYQQSFAKTHNVTIITNTDFEQSLNIKVDVQKANLISASQGTKTIAVSALKIGTKAKVCLEIENPYPSTLKYNIFFIPEGVVYKPKGFFDYLKHARRQKADAYICFVSNKKTSQIVNTLKTLFKLQENPTKLEISVDSMGNIDFSSTENNLSSNQYVSSIVQTGQESCYKIHTYVYFKLLIESQVINAILENYSLDTLQKFIQRQWEYLHNSSLSYIDDEFYKELKVKFQHHCNSVFFPIFRFCFYFPISLQTDKIQRQKKQKQSQSFYLQPKQTQETCFTISNSASMKKDTSFEMVIVNNHSRYDDYKLQLSLVQPKISVGNIAFQRNHEINHEIFIKHYFSAFSKATNQQLLQQGIYNRHKIIPIYLTSQDYDEEFGLFKGQRFFQIYNDSPMNINFSHFGFQNKQNITQWSGLTIEQVQPNSSYIQLTKNNKSLFRVKLCLDQPYEFNLTNPYFHKKINLYLYKDDQFYLSLSLLLRVADNVIQKLKTNTQQIQSEGNKLGYIFLNLVSFAYICLVIVNRKREQTQRYNKIKKAVQKQKKIVVHKKEYMHARQSSQIGLSEEKISKSNFILYPESIGSRIKTQEPSKFIPCHIISQQQIHFFKSLNIEKEKSIFSQSSDDLALKFSIQQSERNEQKSQDRSIRVEQRSQKVQQKSQKGQSVSNQRNSHEQSQQNDILFNSDLQESEQSGGSLSQSILPDGISVCNDQLDTLDGFEDFQFGFESKRLPKQEKIKKEQQFVYYDVFSNHNPLKKVKEEQKENPFPWMKQNEKSKPVRAKKIKKNQP